METKKIDSDISLQILQSRKYRELDQSGKLCCAVSGLCEEAGEVAGLLNREIFKHKEVPLDRWVDEIGDVLWYVTAVASLKGLTLEDLFMHNTAKLQERYGTSYGERENRHPGTQST